MLCLLCLLFICLLWKLKNLLLITYYSYACGENQTSSHMLVVKTYSHLLAVKTYSLWKLILICLLWKLSSICLLWKLISHMLDVSSACCENLVSYACYENLLCRQDMVLLLNHVFLRSLQGRTSSVQIYKNFDNDFQNPKGNLTRNLPGSMQGDKKKKGQKDKYRNWKGP